MKLFQSDISINNIIHNDLQCYVDSGYGSKEIKEWPFYRFIKLWINGNDDEAQDLWVNWLVDEFFKHCLSEKSKGGMCQGSVHRFAIEYMQKNKNECWLNPSLLNRTDVQLGASLLVKKRIQLIESIINKGYQIDMDDLIIAVKINGMYVLKGGHHRAAVVCILGYKKLPGVIVYSKPLWECRKWLIKIKRYLK